MSTDELANSVSSHQRRKSPSLQRILQLYWPAFARTNAMPGFVHRAAYLLAHCRTAVLGGHVKRCDQGHVLDVYYNSCRHRGCPACTATPRANWLAKWQAKMLDSPAHHVVFTVPNELVPLWRMNKSRFTSALFQAASQSLLTLLADPQFMGAKPGLLAALHTWSQTLAAHPHCHFIVTSGGLASDGTWKTAKKDCLLPCRVLMAMFRGKLLAKLRRLLTSGKLALPPERSLPQTLSLLNRLGRTVWNVRLLERYSRAEGVTIYLAKYLRGGPIGNRRILTCRQGQVKFTYLDRRDRQAPRRKTASLAAVKFLKLWAQHIPPTGLHTVRAFGLYASGSRQQLNQARAALQQPAYDPTQRSAAASQESAASLASECTTTEACPKCGSPVRIEKLPRQRLIESCWRKPIGSVTLAPRAPPTHSRPAMATP